MVSGLIEKGTTILVAATAIAVIVITIITMIRSSKLIKKYKSFDAIAQTVLSAEAQDANNQDSSASEIDKTSTDNNQ